MSTKVQTYITVQDLEVEVVRKKIKNLHLGVYPPQGRVRISAPLHVDDETIRLTVISRLAWIRRHQKRFQEQCRQSQRELVGGESHYYRGKRYLLRVKEHNAPPAIRIINNTTMEMSVRPGTDREKREAILNQWYRIQLKKEIPPLIEKWEPKLGVQVAEWGIRRMKTRWGTCNIPARRIWINLELAKKPYLCLEYIVVHEMMHLLERNHTKRFTQLMDQFLPLWRQYREELNQSPLVHEKWGY